MLFQMDTVEVCQDGIPIPGHSLDVRTSEMHDSNDVKVSQKVENKKKKKRKASEAGGRNFTGKVCVHGSSIIAFRSHV